MVGIEKSESLHLEAIVKEREGSNYARLVQPADQPEQPRLSFDGAMKALDNEATALAGRDRFAGAVLVALGGKIVLEKAYGPADREKHVDNTADTKFRIGSMNKMFTAAAVMQLAGEGRIDLSASVGKYLPDTRTTRSRPR